MPGTPQPASTMASHASGRQDGPPAPPRNRWSILAVLCVSLLLVAVDATVLHVAVPAVTEDLRPGGPELLWIVDAYPLVCASLLLFFGTLGDRVGRRRVLLLGYACFGLASALAAYAATPAMLIAARALLGMGGAMIMPATLSILRHVFPDRRERAAAIGVWSAVAAVGAAAGPLAGGLLLEHFWWGSVFLVNIPLMLVCLPVARWLLPESVATGDRAGSWDVAGALLAAAGLFCGIWAVKRAGAGDPFGAGTMLAALASAALLLLFARRQRGRRAPLLDLRAFGRPAFGTAVGCIVLTVLALVGLALVAAQYLQLVLGLSPLLTGLRLLPLSLAAIAAGLAGSRLLGRLGPRRMVALGFVLTAAAVLVLTLLGQEDRPAVMAAGFILLGFGLEATLFGSYESMLSDCPARQAGGAAAIGETAYQFGAGIGIALLGSVMNAVYGSGVRNTAGISAADADAASHSLGEAYVVAARLGGETGRALRESAVQAFVHGMRLTLLVSAVLLLLGALAALRLPRGLSAPGGGPDREAEPGGERNGQHGGNRQDGGNAAERRQGAAGGDAGRRLLPSGVPRT